MSITAKKAATSTRRDQLLETATDLFYRNGCHTTGIDKVLAEAGVAKMTLYKHFRSKEELVLAAAQRFHDRIQVEFEKTVERQNLSPRQKLLAIFDFLASWCRREDFCGCPSVNLAVQFPDHNDPIHRATAEHKQIREDYITEIAQQAGASSPRDLARQLMLLIEGASVLQQVTGRPDFMQLSRPAAEVLIRHCIGDEAACAG